MAIERENNSIRMSEVNDEVTERLRIMAVSFESATANNAVLKTSDGKEVVSMRTTANMLHDHVTFPKAILVDGVKVTTLSGGHIYLYIE